MPPGTSVFGWVTPAQGLFQYYRLLVAVLRILGVRSTRSSPSFVGACGAGMSLRRSCVADFLEGISFTLPCG